MAKEVCHPQKPLLISTTLTMTNLYALKVSIIVDYFIEFNQMRIVNLEC